MIVHEEELKALAGKDRLSIEDFHGRCLMDLVLETKPKTLIEIGTGSGYSTAWILLGLNSNKRGTLMTFDSTIRKPYAWKVAGIPDDRIRKFNNAFAYSVNHFPKKIDFVFHDAGHFFEHVKEDLELVFPMMSPRGIIAIHDIMYSYDMGEKVKKMFEDMGWKYEEKREGCGLGIARKS